ncbi:MAG: hypothetical protein QOC91_1379 [Solirubrobacteraceae bacterium]|nr:hypothetical protein [Solirubrobacteraceae bacterium]
MSPSANPSPQAGADRRSSSTMRTAAALGITCAIAAGSSATAMARPVDDPALMTGPMASARLPSQADAPPATPPASGGDGMLPIVLAAGSALVLGGMVWSTSSAEGRRRVRGMRS